MLENNAYVVLQKDAVQIKDNEVKNVSVVENKFLYEIKNNKIDSCIRFTLDRKNKKFIITIDESPVKKHSKQ